MKKLENFANLMIENNKCKEKEKEIIIYGLQMAMETMLMIITIVVLGFIFGLTKEVLLFFLSFSLIRTYAGGYHLESATACYIASSLVVLTFFMLLKFMNVDYMFLASSMMVIVSSIALFKYAPISTKNNPLDNDAKVHFRKKVIINLIIECIIISILLFNNFEYYAFIMSLGVFISGILVTVQKAIN